MNLNDETLDDLESLHILSYTLSLYSYEDMLRLGGNIKVTETGLNGPNTINDSRMGILNLNDDCPTCDQKNCPGHYGLIDFGEENVIINPLYIKTVLKILNCICHSCSRVLFCDELTSKGEKKKISEELDRILKKPADQNRLSFLEK